MSEEVESSADSSQKRNKLPGLSDVREDKAAKQDENEVDPKGAATAATSFDAESPSTDHVSEMEEGVVPAENEMVEKGTSAGEVEAAANPRATAAAAGDGAPNSGDRPKVAEAESAAAMAAAAAAAAVASHTGPPSAVAQYARSLVNTIGASPTIALLPPKPSFLGATLGEAKNDMPPEETGPPPPILPLSSIRSALQRRFEEENGNQEVSAPTPKTFVSSGFRGSAALGGTESLLTETEVDLAAVNTHQVLKKLVDGQSDNILKHLLMLCNVNFDWLDSTTPPQNSSPTTALSAAAGPLHSVETSVGEEVQAEATEFAEGLQQEVEKASEALRNTLNNAEKSYNTLLQLLPSNQTYFQPGEPLDDGDGLLPDLLPPCVAPAGDATAEFFGACARREPEETKTGGAEDAALTDTSATNESSQNGAEQSEVAKGGESKENSGTNGASSVQNAASSVFSTVLSSVKSSSKPGSPVRSTSITGMFRKTKRTPTQDAQRSDASDADATKPSESPKTSTTSTSEDDPDAPEQEIAIAVDYTVQIDREMLGLTVENVLERTVVRTVLPGGAAKKAGARVGSLIVMVGNVQTANLTHFETIDELRQSQRPLKLVLRRISKEALRKARDEMGRLIRGGGFGLTGQSGNASYDETERDQKNHAVESLTRDDFATALRERWADGYKKRVAKLTSKDEALCKIGERLVWILTLLFIGLEREAAALCEPDEVPSPTPSTASSPGRRAKYGQHEYGDAAKSVGKILMDFSQRHFNTDNSSDALAAFGGGEFTAVDHGVGAGLGRKVNHAIPQLPQNMTPRTMVAKKPGMPQRPGGLLGAGPVRTVPTVPPTESALASIGDVLHRARAFLADPSSPPAALLRGEVISLLCDILDIDTEMQLSEEDATPMTADGKTGPINDLGSAGNLLKLIVLNCSMMKSPGVSSLSSNPSSPSNGDDKAGDHGWHAGNRFLAVVHRLAASRSTSARVTACSLGPVLWSHLDFPHQLQLRGVITRALHDVVVIVRKSTATVLHEIAELVFDSRAVPWLVLMCERAMTDPEPQLRAAAMTLTWHLAEHLPNAFLGDATKGSRSLRKLPPRSDPTFAEVYLLQCKLLPVATRLAEDRSPSVRLAVAAQCDRLCNALGDHWFIVIIDLLQALLADNDERVRSEATLCMPRLVESVLLGSSAKDADVGVLESLLPVAIKLLKDPSTNVRVSLATAAGELLTLLVGLHSLEEISAQADSSFMNGDSSSGTEGGFKKHRKHVDETLIPLVQRLLHDPDPEVTSAALRAVTNASRGNVREISSPTPQRIDTEDDTVSLSSSHQSIASYEKKEPVFIPVLSEVQVLRLLPTLSDLSTSPQWRVRQSAVEIVPALLGCTHRLETRSEIAQLCVQLMGDSVDAVRRTAAECLCLGGGSLGGHGDGDRGEWMTAIVLPHLRSCRESADSKQRMLCLKMVEVILLNGVCPKSGDRVTVVTTDSGVNAEAGSPLSAILELAASLKDDRVVNVRLNVGRVLGSVVHMLEEEDLAFVVRELEDQISTELTRAGEGDRDVIYFARKAVGWAKSRLDEVTMSDTSTVTSSHHQ